MSGPATAETDVLVVGGGILGAWAAYWLSKKRGLTVSLIEQGEFPNSCASSSEVLKSFPLTYGKDSFATAVAAKSMPLWLELNRESGQPIFETIGFLELISSDGREAEESLRILGELKLPIEKWDKARIQKRYPVIRSPGVKFGLFHPDGGIVWAGRAVSVLTALAQKAGVRLSPGTKAVSVLNGPEGVSGIKDSAGKIRRAKSYLFCAGAWTAELLKPWKIPLLVTCHDQLYVRPPFNKGRYHPRIFPVLKSAKEGVCAFPLHFRGYLKIVDMKRGKPTKPGLLSAEEGSSFLRRSRAFFARFIPELAEFTEWEGSQRAFASTKDSNPIIDRLPKAANAYVACGLGMESFGWAPLIARNLADLAVGGRPSLNLQRFRLGR